MEPFHVFTVHPFPVQLLLSVRQPDPDAICVVTKVT